MRQGRYNWIAVVLAVGFFLVAGFQIMVEAGAMEMAHVLYHRYKAFSAGQQNYLSDPSTWRPDMLMVLAIVLLVFAIGAQRRRRYLRLQRDLVEKQERVIGFQNEALNAHSIVSITDARGRIVGANENFLKVFGYDEEQILGQKYPIIFANGRDNPAFHEYSEHMARGVVWSGEHKAVTKSGEQLVMTCTSVPLTDSNGDLVQVMSLRTDVTERRKHEEEQVVIGLLEKLQDSVVVADAETYQITYMNEASLRSVGWTLEEARQHVLFDAVDSVDVDLAMTELNKLRTGQAQFVMAELRNKGVAIEASARLHVEADGNAVFICVLRDISARKRLEAAKMETVSIVSHELRTPLTSIKGALRLLQSGIAGDLSPEAISVIDIAQRNSERLLLTVNDILDLEKIKAGKMDFTLSPLNLAEFLAEAVEANSGYGEEVGVRFVTRGLENQAEVLAHPDRMMQVMSNLMSNAAKFSPEGAEVEVALLDQDSHWRIAVSDRGPGIPEKLRHLVFQTFSQIDNDAQHKRKGTGLGLTISKKIVEHHEGRIDFENREGGGSTFFVDLPKTGRENDATLPDDPSQIAAE